MALEDVKLDDLQIGRAFVLKAKSPLGLPTQEEYSEPTSSCVYKGNCVYRYHMQKYCNPTARNLVISIRHCLVMKKHN